MSQKKVPLAGVIGCPVAHSRSPSVHGHWLRRYGLAGHYAPLHVEPKDLAEVLRTLPKAGYVGVNVTIPHKEAALALADEVSETARRIGAANTLTFRDGKIHADNTDAYGFMANLRQSAPDWRPDAAPAAVLGAGGAARAIICALIDAGVREIRLANRSVARAEALAAEFGSAVKVTGWAPEMLQGCATLVNTTSLGMVGQPEVELDLTPLPASALVTDIVYTPLETGLLRVAKAHGRTTVDGLGMLLHQAAPGFERWFGRKPEVDVALRSVILDA